MNSGLLIDYWLEIDIAFKIIRDNLPFTKVKCVLEAIDWVSGGFSTIGSHFKLFKLVGVNNSEPELAVCKENEN